MNKTNSIILILSPLFVFTGCIKKKPSLISREKMDLRVW
jgi:hypothetical protein